MRKFPKAVHQLLRFILVGGCSVLVDLVTYSFLIKIISITLSKAIGFLAGTTFSYTFNKLWTFGARGHSNRELAKFSMLYAGTMAINVGINHWLLNLTNHNVIASFTVATAVTTIINFTGQRIWVFKNPSNGRA